MSNKIFNKLTFLFVFSILVFGAQSALAATRTVTKTADTNDNACNADCSLREAVATAAAGDTIVFAAGLANQTITLAQGVIKINKNLTINGIDGLQVSGNNASRVFYITGGVKVTIDNLDLKNGFATYPDVLQNGAGDGGAVLVDDKSSLTFNNSSISSSSAMGGGAIAAFGTLKLNNMLIVSNSATAIGGGIEAGDEGTIVEITDSSIKYNQSQRGGGLGMYHGTLRMTGTTVSGNTALTNNDGRGGGIYLSGTNYFSTSYGTDYLITYSTVSGNTGLTGGGIYNEGNLVFINSTLSGNKATKTHGGGLVHSATGGMMVGALTMRNATVTLNSAAAGSGGGVYRNGAYGELNVGNTIIAGNSNPNNTAPDVKGTVNSLGNNLFGYLNGMNLLGNWSGVVFNPNPGLSALADNGGKTRTHMLQFSSPAINAGNDQLATDENGFLLGTDQRGKGRFNGTVDIGAVERYNERVIIQ